jgi:hypothetical protein
MPKHVTQSGQLIASKARFIKGFDDGLQMSFSRSRHKKRTECSMVVEIA